MADVADDGAVRRVERAVGLRFASWAQHLVVIAYLLGAGVTLLTAAIGTGDYAGLLDPGLERYGDPKDWIPPLGPASAWNPLTWIFGVARAVALFIAPLAILGGLVGAAGLAQAARVRSRRPTVVRLAVGTVLCFALVAFTLTPYGASLHNWLLD
ncbi:hypothetical protein SAMN05444365_106161 [Micromonospora pattaloongensis]|uniref:Uncharacterized protein n=1 Tax=Micromonospora pattaloongensis TaxID=405436 RepID=A0A1H3QVD5_9ACTN|nr:hypothetical protein [Micromonospora pattaloongensis]SDZ17562.1 hypothetical protein SAMN05444365_106161 [Micromonospora pattaloongensis]